MSSHTELKMAGANDDKMAADHHIKMENDCTDRIKITETHLHGNEGICILQQTVFVKSELPNDQVFENAKVKTEPVFKDDEEVLKQGSKDDCNSLDNHVKEKKKVAQVKMKTIAKDRVAAMREKLKNKLRKNSQLRESNQAAGRKWRVNNPELYTCKTDEAKNDSGKEILTKVEETSYERRRRLARERMRRKRMFEKVFETEDERELRRLKCRLQKQRSRRRLKELPGHLKEPELSLDSDRDRHTGQNNICVDFNKNNRKHASDGMEYSYFHENSEERYKKLDRERHKSKYRARKQMEREVLGIEEESDMMTSRRCLDFD